MISFEELTQQEKDTLHRYYATMQSRDLSGEIMKKVWQRKHAMVAQREKHMLMLISVLTFLSGLVLGGWVEVMPTMSGYFSLLHQFSFLTFVHDALALFKWLRGFAVLEPPSLLPWLMVVVAMPLTIALNRLFERKKKNDDIQS